MANRRIAGITIEIGGDTSGLDKALKGVDSQLRSTQTKLKDVNKLLKLDPKNTELLTQKQKLLKESIDSTKDRLKTLKSVQKDSVTTEQWEDLQREIIETQQNLDSLEDEYRSFGSVASQKIKATGQQLQTVGGKITAVGTNMTKYVTTPIAAVGTAAYVAFTEVDEGMDTIITKTGATGDALDEMGQIMQEIATEIPTSFADAGEAVGEVNTRFGATGAELKGLSEQFIMFCKLNDTNLTTSVDASQKALSAFGLDASSASGYLDTLTHVAQATGVSVDTLMQGAVANSTAFKEMGLSLNTATEFMGQLEVSGADSSAVMSGLSKALKNATAEGIPLDQALANLQTTVLNGTDSTDGLTEAYDLFGKSGAQVFELVKSGALDFTQLGQSATDASGTVVGTFNATLDPADQFTTAMNALKETGAAIAEVVMPVLSDVLGRVKDVILDLKSKWDGLDDTQKGNIIRIGAIAAALGPLITTVGSTVTGVGKLTSAFGGCSLKAKLIGAAVAVAAGLIIAHWDDIKKFWEETLKPALQNLWDFIVKDVVPAVTEAWEGFKEAVGVVFEAVKDFWTSTLQPALQALWDFIVNNVVPAAIAAWEDFKEIAGVVFETVKKLWDETLKPALQALWDFVVKDVVPAANQAFEDLRKVVGAVFGAISDFWETTLKPVFNAIRQWLEETLKPCFENVFNAIKEVVDIRLNAIKDIWGNVKQVYEGIVQFFSGVFSGDWETAWNGIQTIVSGVWDAIKRAAEAIWEEAKVWGKTIIDNFTLAFNNAWDLVKEDVISRWNAIREKASELWTAALEWGANLINNFKDGIVNTWNSVVDSITGLFDSIPNKIKELVDSALNWGKDLIENFKSGITQKWEDLKQSVSDVGQSIKDFLGFSKPKEGPLSDFDTYAPDMIDLFVAGINESAHKITTVMGNLVGNIKAAFKLAGTGGQSEFNQGLNSYWGDAMIKIIKDPIQEGYNAVWNMNWWDLGNHIMTSFAEGCKYAAGQVRDAFSFSGIHVNTPHISVGGWNEAGGTYYPWFKVDWYRKAYDNPVMFTSPTVLGTGSGLKGFGDGPGGEIVLSADKLRQIVGEAGDTTFNIYAQPGQSAEQIAREVQRIMVREQRQRSAAYA